jgi:signal transduction histidine kinase
MRERAESIGAKFELTSRSGRTCVEVSLAAP